jgi:hypothetical protein
LILISGAYFLEILGQFSKCQNQNLFSYLWLEIEPGFVGNAGFGGKCPLPDLGLRVSLKKKLCFAFILQTEYTPPTTMAVSFRFL